MELISKWGEKHVNMAQNMLYIAWMVILGGHNIKKTSFQNSKTSIFELFRVKNCMSRLYTNPLGDPPPLA